MKKRGISTATDALSSCGHVKDGWLWAGCFSLGLFAFGHRQNCDWYIRLAKKPSRNQENLGNKKRVHPSNIQKNKTTKAKKRNVYFAFSCFFLVLNISFIVIARTGYFSCLFCLFFCFFRGVYYWRYRLWPFQQTKFSWKVFGLWTGCRNQSELIGLLFCFVFGFFLLDIFLWLCLVRYVGAGPRRTPFRSEMRAKEGKRERERV